MSNSFVTPANPNRVQHGQEPILLDDVLLPPLQARADANGRAEVVTDVVQPGDTWKVGRISVTSESDAPEARVYVGAEADRNQVDATSMGEDDAADYPRGLTVPSGEQLRIVWTGATEGDRCTARIELQKIGYVAMTTKG